MKQPRDQHWENLLGTLERMADGLGHGNITVRIWFHDGQPRELDLLERVEKHHLGKTAASLKGEAT